MWGASGNTVRLGHSCHVTWNLCREFPSYWLLRPMFPGIPPSPCPGKEMGCTNAMWRACREPCVVDLFGSFRLSGSRGDSCSKSYKTLATLVESNHATGPHDARYTPTMPSEPAITVSVEGMKFQQLGSKPSHRVWTYLIWEKNAKEALGVWVKSRRHV